MIQQWSQLEIRDFSQTILYSIPYIIAIKDPYIITMPRGRTLIQPDNSSYEPGKARYNWHGNHVHLYTSASSAVPTDSGYLETFTCFIDKPDPNCWEPNYFGGLVALGHL